MAKTPTWQRKAGQNPNGGLNEAGRRSLKAAGHDIKRPQPEGGSRRDSFCARMKGMKAKLTSSETANDPDSRINKSLRAWNCHADGGPVWEKDRPKGLGKPHHLTPSEKRSAKAAAKAAGRPYPNLVDNVRAARADGGALKAAFKLAQDVIKSYHGSPYQFEKFKDSKIGSGVGAQAYGHGIYTSDNPNVARGYRPTTSGMTIGGRPVYSVYKDIERQAHNVPITEANKYYDKLDVLEQLMHHGDALAIKDAAKNEAFSPEAYKWFQTNVEPRLKAPGGLYEVNLHADPKKFIDLYSQMSLSDPLRERVASLAQHELNKANAESAYKNAQEAMQTVRRKDVFGSDLQGALDTLLGPKGSNARSAAGIPSDIKGPEAVSRYLNKEGYAGFTYPHGLDAPGPETLNRVIFDPKIMEIVRRYARGGMTRHGYATDGSVEGDVSFLDTPDFEDSGSLMAKLAPSKPQKSPSEFIKQELAYGDKQLPQYDPEAGKKTALEALEMAKMAGYLTPASPYIAAGDFAQQMLSGEPMGAAIASAFLPGGKYAKMAGAALASQAGPEEAEAGLLTPKMFRNLYQYALAHPQHSDPILKSEAIKAITSMQTPLTGKIAQPGHIYGLSHDTAPLDVVSTIRKMRGVNLLPTRQKSWLDLYNEGKGGTFIGLGGDRSRLGRMTEINGQKLGWPVDWHAGPEYMLEPNPGSVWANAEDASSTLNNQILRASRNGTRPVFGAYMPMGAQSLDSSVQMIDTILSLMHGRGKLEPKVAEEFDNMLRSGSFYPKDQESLIEKARTKFKDWPGINNPKAASDFIKKRARDADESLRVTGTDRGALVKAIDSASWNEKGFPNVGEIRVAGTNPDLLAAPNNMVGYRIVRLDPDQAARAVEAESKKKFGHNTYTSDLHGEYWGDVDLAPRDLAMPDSAIKILNKRKVAMQNPYGPKKPRKLGERDPETGLFPGALDKSKPFRIDHPMSPDFRGRQAFRKVSEQARKQPITQRWFDTLSEGQQRLLKEGYERGGKVEDALRLAKKILSKG